jgi:transposase
MCDREGAGREASPSGGVIDSKTVKAPKAKTRAYDAAKKIAGRKRHITVDTDARLLMVNLTPAEISDSAGAQTIFDGICKRWPRIKHFFADGVYDRAQLMDKAAYLGPHHRGDQALRRIKGFEVFPRCWVVERTFGWMMRWRRLVRDYEERVDVLRGHDPPRFRKHLAAEIGPSMIFQKDSKTERKAEIEPNRMGDHFGGKTMVAVEGVGRRDHLRQIPEKRRQLVNVTAPV